MEMYPPPNSPQYTPTAEQLAREQEIRRFNRLYLYLPLGLLTFVAVLIIALLLVGVFSPGIMGTEAFMSALADVIVVLWIMPLLVLMALATLGFVALFINRRQKRKQLPEDSLLRQHGRLELLLWQAEHYIELAQTQVNHWAKRVTEPLITNHGRMAAAEAWMDILTRPFRRDDETNAD